MNYDFQPVAKAFEYDDMNYNFEDLFEAFEYLDGLRESGTVNMFGATEHVALKLGYDRKTARDLVLMWMQSFDSEVTAEDRARSFGETV
jgi:hypothetical protein